MKKKLLAIAAALVLVVGAAFTMAACGGGDVKFAVTFDANKPAGVSASVSGLPAKITDVEKDALITEPAAAPTLAGYDFKGWYKEAACTTAWNFAGDKVTSNVTLYAKWTVQTMSLSEFLTEIQKLDGNYSGSVTGINNGVPDFTNDFKVDGAVSYGEEAGDGYEYYAYYKIFSGCTYGYESYDGEDWDGWKYFYEYESNALHCLSYFGDALRAITVSMFTETADNVWELDNAPLVVPCDGYTADLLEMTIDLTSEEIVLTAVIESGSNMLEYTMTVTFGTATVSIDGLPPFVVL